MQRIRRLGAHADLSEQEQRIVAAAMLLRHKASLSAFVSDLFGERRV